MNKDEKVVPALLVTPVVLHLLKSDDKTWMRKERDCDNDKRDISMVISDIMLSW